MLGAADIALTEAQMSASRDHVAAPFDHVTVPDGDHWLPVRHAATVTDHLLRFLGPHAV